MSFGNRVARLRERLSDFGGDAGLLTGLHDIRWLTGFTGSNAAVVVRADAVIFITDFRYAEQSQAEVSADFERVVSEGPLRAEIGVHAAGATKLLFEPASISVLDLGLLEEALVGGTVAEPAQGLVSQLRARKDPVEVEAIAAACQLADEAFEAVIGRGLIGRLERDVSLAIEIEARRLGAEGMSFAPIVASGGHGSLPHAEPRGVPIERDSFVVIDWGVVLEGYCSDCTRTVATGDPGRRAMEVYGIVNRARQAGLAALQPGADCVEVDEVARAEIEEAGFGEHFGHGLGHGVGLEVHEAPTLGKLGRGELAEGMTVTVEPGIYLPGEFGVRIEDLAVVGSDGAHCLTSLDRELLTVD